MGSNLTPSPLRGRDPLLLGESEFFIDNLLVRIHYITVMIRWTGLALWELGFPFSGSLTSTFVCVPEVPQSFGAEGMTCPQNETDRHHHKMDHACLGPLNSGSYVTKFATHETVK